MKEIIFTGISALKVTCLIASVCGLVHELRRWRWEVISFLPWLAIAWFSWLAVPWLSWLAIPWLSWFTRVAPAVLEFPVGRAQACRTQVGLVSGLRQEAVCCKLHSHQPVAVLPSESKHF